VGEVWAGRASWTDRTLIESGWYPRGVDTPAKRLRFYTGHSPLVEVDAASYALSSGQTAALWAERTPPGSRSTSRAVSLVTHHATRVGALPFDLRPAVERAGNDLGDGPVRTRSLPPQASGGAPR
jgi:uncharacterized protein YecE (DUF72 family)